MTKEEALGKHWIAHNKKESDEDTQLWLTADEIETVHAAMDEYAKQEAIAYAHWVIRKMFPHFTPEAPSEESQNLYNQFKNQQ